MIYDRLIVALLSVLATEREGSTNATIARYLITHAGESKDFTVKGVAAACHVGVGSVSRFCRETGFSGFDDLRLALEKTSRSFEQSSDSEAFSSRAKEHACLIGDALQQATCTVDERMLQALVHDLLTHEKVFICGMLKAQAAAVDLQVDLLMLGKYAETCVSHAEQLERISTAGRDELVIVFSYTGSYFSAGDLSRALARIDRPRIWVVAGAKKPQPDCVYGCLSFASNQSQLAHPFQLEMVAALIAQEYARQKDGAAGPLVE